MFKKDLRADVLVGSFLCGLFGDRWVENRLEQMICFKPVDFDEIRRFQRILKRILD